MTSGKENLTGLVRVMADMLRREGQGERLVIEIGPHTALMLAAQCMARENDEATVLPPEAFDAFLSELRRAFADEPEVLALLQLHDAPDGRST